jgi:cytochrome P450 monooxygenase
MERAGLAAGDFSVKHIRDHRPYITTVVDARIDAMIANGDSAELYEDFCLPIPSEVAGHIFGVSEDGQDAF